MVSLAAADQNLHVEERRKRKIFRSKITTMTTTIITMLVVLVVVAVLTTGLACCVRNPTLVQVQQRIYHRHLERHEGSSSSSSSKALHTRATRQPQAKQEDTPQPPPQVFLITQPILGCLGLGFKVRLLCKLAVAAPPVGDAVFGSVSRYCSTMCMQSKSRRCCKQHDLVASILSRHDGARWRNERLHERTIVCSQCHDRNTIRPIHSNGRVLLLLLLRAEIDFLLMLRYT